MQISTQLTPNLSPMSYASAPAEPSKSFVERIVDNTVLSANYLASGLSGGIGGVGAYGRSVLGTTASTTVSAWKNLWKTETIGPNLKILGTLLAAPAAAAVALAALPVSLCIGIHHGVKQVDSSKPREFTVGAAGVEGFAKTRKGFESFKKETLEGLEEMGNHKLEPGEKPVDIPLIKTGKTLAVGAASAAVGGVTGTICAVVSTGRQVGAGVARAFTDESLNLPGKVLAGAGAVVGGTVQGVTYGAGSAISVFGKGLVETWKEDSVIKGSKAALDRAAMCVAAAAAPDSAMTQERPSQTQP